MVSYELAWLVVVAVILPQFGCCGCFWQVGKGTMLGWYSNYVDYGDDMWSWNFMVILVAMALSLRARGEHESKWRGM